MTGILAGIPCTSAAPFSDWSTDHIAFNLGIYACAIVEWWQPWSDWSRHHDNRSNA